MAILLRTVRDEAKGLIGWAVLAAVSSFAYMVFYKVAVTSGAWKDFAAMIDNMPPMVKAFIGGNINLDTLNGFLQALVFNGVLLLYLVIFSGISALSICARDMDAGTMEFVLSLPVKRWQVFGIRGGVFLGEIAILQAVLVLATWVGTLAIGKAPDLRLFALAGVYGWALFFCVSGLFVLISTFIDDYQRGLFLLLGAGLVLYFSAAAFDTASGAMGLAEELNPFGHYDTSELFRTGRLPISDALGLLAAGAIFWTLSACSFERKQI